MAAFSQAAQINALQLLLTFIVGPRALVHVAAPTDAKLSGANKMQPAMNNIVKRDEFISNDTVDPWHPPCVGAKRLQAVLLDRRLPPLTKKTE